LLLSGGSSSRRGLGRLGLVQLLLKTRHVASDTRELRSLHAPRPSNLDSLL
jgi:hypothetical protein